MARLPVGRIMWAMVKGRGGEVKKRPVVILCDITPSGPDDIIPVVPGSESSVDSSNDACIVIHDSYQFDRATKLSRPTALVCNWRPLVRYKDLREPAGFLRANRMIEIAEKIAKYFPPA